MNQPQISIQKISELARIQLSAEESSSLQSEIDDILQMAESINDDKLSSIEPFFGQIAPDNLKSVRTDEQANSFTRDTALQNAPDTDDEYYLVPPVFG